MYIAAGFAKVCGDFSEALYPLGSRRETDFGKREKIRGEIFYNTFIFFPSVRLNELAFAAPRAAFLGIVREFQITLSRATAV